MNILTFDVEEWFHLLDFDSTRTEVEWGKYEVRIYENIERIFRILEDTNTEATFFIIGWVAKTYPDLIKKIADKYQIGCHTMNHQLVWQQTPAEFRADVEAGVKMLEDITGKKVECFRAPGFSIRESEGWAFEILADLGIKYDCSVFPAAHAHGGLPSYPQAAPGIIEYNGIQMKEFPAAPVLPRILAETAGGQYGPPVESRADPMHAADKRVQRTADLSVNQRILHIGSPRLSYYYCITAPGK